eukprot:Nitzschia sp. Nitz4//scaffold255_size41878//2185//7104//NITZ4_007399-RA/size41878-processed-gene-0.17-mRNA-1//-1//CDS//3329544353//6414//frame0
MRFSSWLVGVSWVTWSCCCWISALASDNNGNNKEWNDLVSPILNREMQVSVEAPWPSSPYNVFCEAHVLMQQQHQSLAFLQALAAKSLSTGERIAWTDYASATQSVLDILQEFQVSVDASLLSFALSMRAASPTCELHRVLAQESLMNQPLQGEAFVVLNGQDVYTNLQELPSELSSTATDVQELLLPKETPPTTSTTANGLVILYANIGSLDFARWYTALQEKQWPVIVRHLGTSSNDDDDTTSSTYSSATTLAGFGVRIDIRSLEYKVFNERTTSDTQEASMLNLTEWAPSSLLSQQYLAGVNLSALLGVDDETPPTPEQLALQSELWKRHDDQTEVSGMVPPAWQRRQLGLQAATVIVQEHASPNGDPLVLLQELSQNLPAVASTLVHVTVPDNVQQIAESFDAPLHDMIRQSAGGFFINGRATVMDRGSFNVFELIARLYEEQAAIQDLHDSLYSHFPTTMAPAAMETIQSAWIQGDSFFASTESSESGKSSSSEPLYQQYLRINLASDEDGAVRYILDIEANEMFSQWPQSLDQAVMFARQFGMPPTVQRNLFTVMVVEDPIGDRRKEPTLGKPIVFQLLQAQYPTCLASLLVDMEDVNKCAAWVRDSKPKAGEACPNDKSSWLDKKKAPSAAELKQIPASSRDLHRLYSLVSKRYGAQNLQGYDQHITENIQRIGSVRSGPLSVHDLLSMHIEMTQSPESSVDLANTLIKLGEGSDDISYFKGVRYAVDKGLRAGMSFFNGRPLPEAIDEDANMEFNRILQEEQNAIIQLISQRIITDSSRASVYKTLLNRGGKKTYSKVHPLFANLDSDAFVHMDHAVGAKSWLTPTSTKGKPLDKDAVFVIDAYLDFSARTGKELATTFLELAAKLPATMDGKSVSVVYRVMPSTKDAAESPFCSLFENASVTGQKALLKALQSGKTDKKATGCTSDLPYLKGKLPSTNFVVANGRFYALDDTTLQAGDLELLLQVQMSHAVAVTSSLKTFVDAKSPFEAISRTTSFLAVASQNGKGDRIDIVNALAKYEERQGVTENPLRFEWNGDCEGDKLKMRVTAVVDPLSESAQRLSPLLHIIRDELKLPLTLVLAPAVDIGSDAKIPIQSFYRFVAGSRQYQSSENPPMAYFSNLPPQHTLTLQLDIPEPWDIQQSYSVQDTDNLRCSLQTGCSDEAALGQDMGNVPMYEKRHLTDIKYSLEHLLFFGQCVDTKRGTPNGLQLSLSKPQKKSGTSVEIGADGSVGTVASSDSKSATPYSDTVVMKTAGYWQLRANPGVWDLRFMDGSRGAQIFDMMDGKVGRMGQLKVVGPNKNNNTKTLIMGDFTSRGTSLVVQKKPGHENDELFSQTDLVADDDDTVHVFSLATGRLYERLLKIMMLSVTKRTSTKVKFWLFGNFLSPDFKASARAMADRIGCQVEFVTYKWPEWLRGQTEKQRIIWGYKILFLDVMFPQNLKKIIYVDADQVVRGDLKELWDMDLQGAPYGYTPMCESRESTIGYAFWKTGFWERHLAGKPYHISALYVVDLAEFRRTLVGDQLRAIYQQLSADPGSLANLDQDLPNFAQHEVPIFSLPQEWLWCESWCSDETKPKAKTIDLCNNPLHKEPKLSMAKRIISGELFEESWEELDAEVDQYEKDYFESIAVEAY